MANTEKVGIITHIDDNGNKTELYPVVKTDSTLKETGTPADAAATGEAIAEATNIAKGRNRARVFATTAAMESWLKDAANKGVCIVGDNLYIEDVDVPDWWVSEVLEEADAETGYYYKIAQLETQKVDLTNYVATGSNAELNTLKLGGSDISMIYNSDDDVWFAVKKTDGTTLQTSIKNIAENKISRTGGTMTGNLMSRSIIPETDNTYHLGTSSSVFQTVRSFSLRADYQNSNYVNAYVQTIGTASTLGYGRLTIGNSTPKGTAGNARGQILVYDENGHYVSICAKPNTANPALELPTKSGTIPVASLSGTTLTINF